MNANLNTQRNTRLNVRRIFIIITTIVLICSLFNGVVNALSMAPSSSYKANLENVRAYAAAATVQGANYAVDAGNLYAGTPTRWRQVQTPANIIVGAVAVDRHNAQAVYMGAANEMAIYRSLDGGKAWLRIPLTDEYVGGVTDLAVDSHARLLYVGTDTAGIFRLRDVGSSMIVAGHQWLDEPVLEIAADSTGAGLALARTPMSLYRATPGDVKWTAVDNLGSSPAALAIADATATGTPATIYVGTTDRGLLKSVDGLHWTTANAGLGMLPGTRLQVNALAVDPLQPQVLYAATSYLSGSSTVHISPAGVFVSNNASGNWGLLNQNDQQLVTELLPLSGRTNAVYALTTASRTPLALGNAPAAETSLAQVAPATVNTTTGITLGSFSWLIAALAALALLYALANDLTKRLAAARTLVTHLVYTTR